MTLTLGKKMRQEGFIVCMNYEFNLLHHVGVVAKRLSVAATERAAHEGDNNTPSGPLTPTIYFQMATAAILFLMDCLTPDSQSPCFLWEQEFNCYPSTISRVYPSAWIAASN